MTRPEEILPSTQDLSHVIEGYGEWFMSVLRSIFYPDDYKAVPKIPVSLSLWRESAGAKNHSGTETLTRLDKLHADLIQGAESLLGELKENGGVPYKEFDRLATFYEEFINALNRVERERLAGETGIDINTGLRRAEMFFSVDFGREMDRLERQGKPFAIGLVKIDHYETLQRTMEPGQLQAAVKHIVILVQNSVRSFDDIYRLEDDIFLVSLKQTSAAGGIRAFHRLKADLRQSPVPYMTSQGPDELTLSSCVAEPVPGDDVNQLVENMKNDLSGYTDKEGAILEYLEMSPLQRLVKEGKV